MAPGAHRPVLETAADGQCACNVRCEPSGRRSSSAMDACHTSRGGKTTTLGKCAASSTMDPGKCCECEEFKEARPCAECANGAGGCVELCVENQLSKHVFIPVRGWLSKGDVCECFP
eukprot:COSAG06_NODE_69_length_26016_cov_6.603272_14_plen_117_part_00